MKWLEKLLRLNAERSQKLRVSFIRNRLPLTFIVLLLGVGSGVLASGVSFLSPDTVSIKERTESARIENAWNNEDSQLEFKPGSETTKISETLEQVKGAYSYFGTGALVNPCPVSDNISDGVLLPEWRGFRTLNESLPNGYSLLSGSLPTGDSEIMISDTFASYISERGYSVDEVEIAPGFDSSNLVGLPIYLSKASDNYYIPYENMVYDSAELKPWFEKYGIRLTISGIFKSNDGKESQFSFCALPLLERLENEQFPLDVSYKTNFAGAPVTFSTMDGWFPPNGTFEKDFSHISLISDDVPSIKDDNLSVMTPTYGANQVWPVYVSYSMFRSLMFSPASPYDWSAVNELLPNNLNPTGTPIRVTASFDQVFNDTIQELAARFTAYACFNPQTDYSSLYDENKESELYFQTEGKAQPESLTNEQRRDVFGFWLSQVFTWCVSAEDDPAIGQLQTEFDKNLTNLLDYFVGEYANPRAYNEKEFACIPHLPLYSQTHQPIGELAVIGVVPDDCSELTLFVDSPEAYESLGGTIGDVALDKDNWEDFSSNAKSF